MKQFRCYEKVAGLSVVLSLVLGCGTKEPEPQTDGSPPEPVQAAAELKGPAALLPASVAGLTQTETPRSFGPTNLFELINGGAEVFAEHGLVSMAVVDYADKARSGVTLTVELYDMGSSQGAVGRLSHNLASLDDPSQAGEGLPEPWRDRGQLGAGDLWTWKGRHLLHATLMDESDSATADSIRALGLELLPKTAEAVLGPLADESLPQELRLLPTTGLVARSQQRWPKNTVGLPELGPGWSARYRDGDAQYVAFVTDASADPAKAEAAAAALDTSKLAVVAGCGRVLGVQPGEKAQPRDLEAHLSALKQAFCPSTAP